MRKLLGVVLVAVLVGAAWLFAQRFEIRGLDAIQVVSREGLGDPLPNRSARGETIRVAAFNLHVFGPTKAGNPKVVHRLARIIRQFDIVAVQEIRSQDRTVLYTLIDAVNEGGGRYEIAAGPRLGRSASKEQFAYIFDATQVELDRYQMYTVRDPNDLVHREPLVGWFRTLAAPPEQAFTFTLINVHSDPDEAADEALALLQLLDEVRNDGRGEDDVVMLGDFNLDRDALLEGAGSVVSAPVAKPTNTRGSKQYDNLLLDERATVEFTGRAGVFDFLREFNLTIDEALEVSDHLPVWAEFSVWEGGPESRVAEQPGSNTLR